MKALAKLLRERVLCVGVHREQGAIVGDMIGWMVWHADEWRLASKGFARRLLRRVFRLSRDQTELVLGELLFAPRWLDPDLILRLDRSLSPERLIEGLAESDALLLGTLAGFSGAS